MFDIGARFLILFGLIVLLVLGLTLQQTEPGIAEAALIVQVEVVDNADHTVWDGGRTPKFDKANLDQKVYSDLGKEISAAF